MSKYQTKKGMVLESDLSKYMILARIKSKEALRAHTTVGSNVTMLKYFDDPEKMPIGNLKEILTALKIPKEERLQILARLIDN